MIGVSVMDIESIIERIRQDCGGNLITGGGKRELVFFE
jgi:hypothetical protein